MPHRQRLDTIARHLEAAREPSVSSFAIVRRFVLENGEHGVELIPIRRWQRRRHARPTCSASAKS
jgi:hypothetical protein